MDSTKQSQIAKKKRGRPRKNSDKIEQKLTNDKKEKKDENIVLFLALSDEESEDSKNSDNAKDSVHDNVTKINPQATNNNFVKTNHQTHQTNHQIITSSVQSDDSGEDNRFTVNDTETKNEVESISDSQSDDSGNIYNVQNKQLSVNMLIDELKKCRQTIAHLKSKGGNAMSSYNSSKPSNINYHCVQMINTDIGKTFVPKPNDCECWWCDDTFDDMPAYIVNNYRNGIYYVFGNFCSFNCALKYNIKMLKDFKFNTRHALTNSLRIKVTGITTPIKFAGDRELLLSKGGKISIDKFREGFSVISSNYKMNMPPLIPLVHVIEENRRD